MANSNIAGLKESAEAQLRLNPKGALMLDPQFALFCANEHGRALAQIAKLEADIQELPESLRDPQAVLERGGMLNELLEQRNEMARLLRYLLDHSNARSLLSDGYIADCQHALGRKTSNREAKS